MDGTAKFKWVAKAVLAWRLYIGSGGKVPIRIQQKLYDRARKASKGHDVELATVARGLGPIVPQPGKDY